MAGIRYDLGYHDRDVKVMLHFLPIPLLVDMEKILEFVNHAVFGITQILFIKCVSLYVGGGGFGKNNISFYKIVLLYE